MKISSNELLNIKGGGKIAYGIIITVGGLISLIVGIIDGYLRPLKCNK